MHIPDGYLGPPTYGSLWAAMLGIWSYAARKVQRELKETQLPHLAMASAFSFVAMIFAVPLPGGTTAHITGATLIAILLGPWTAVIAVSTALVIQALLFGDGGVTAIAANCFNIAFASSFAGYGAYRLIAAVNGRLRAGKEGEQHRFGLIVNTAGTAFASYVGINVAAVLTALELGIQPMIHGSQSSSYFPYGLTVTFPAVVIPHLTLVGALEAVVTAAVFTFLQKGRNTMTTRIGMALAMTVSLLLVQVPAASAHDYLIEQKGNDLLLLYGHGEQAMDFEASKVSKLKAVDAQGKDLAVQKEQRSKAMALKIAGQPAAVMAELDNGYWSKTIYGWKELPKRKASRVVEAVRSLYFTKTLLSWNATIQEASGGMRLEIAPMSDPFASKPGDQLSVKVLGSGKPLAGLEVIGFDHTKRGTTDKDGLIKVPISAGLNLITVEYKEKIKDDPDADALSMTATLTFEVKK
ncbi:MAG: cobalt transporter CbiM [Nitrospirae bacterium]|nr:cobalt transporter CbiM [Nitrospirota bacterium]NTW64891.1 cobalt transporter CbiM [Nitrospirota bacterium]